MRGVAALGIGVLGLLVPCLTAAPTGQSPSANATGIAGGGGVAWSPTRQELAFGVRVGGRQGIAVARPDGSGLRLLTPSPDPDSRVLQSSDPVWAPGGDRLAFTSSFAPAGRGFQLVRVINRDGSGLRTVAEGYSPTWAPDGRRLAFGTLDPTASPSGTVVADLRTNAQTTLAGLGAPAWQPHGELLAVTGGRSGGSGNVVVVLRGDGSGRRVLTAGEAPVWSGDGRVLAYDLGGSVYVIRSNGTAKRRLFGVPGGDLKAWAPTGNLLAVSTRRGAFVVDVLTGRARSVLGHVVEPSVPSWSPDGRRVAFVVGSRIYLARADGGGGGFVDLRAAASHAAAFRRAATFWLAPVAVVRGTGMPQVGLDARGNALAAWSVLFGPGVQRV